jgi:uncharacterized membrane protein YkvA (DUF1232 family)
MTTQYAEQYSNDSLWYKFEHYAKAAGLEVVEKALYLYFALQNTNTPAWAKMVIFGALGYFISPVDAIPDFMPPIGYTDDLGVLAMALITVSMYIDDEVKQKAKAKLSDWFD